MTTIRQRTGIAGLVQRAWWEIRYFPIGKTVLYLYLGLPVACQWGQFDSPRQGMGVVKPLFSTSSDKEVRTVHDSYGGEANWQPVLFRHIEYTDGTTGKLVYHYHQPKFGGFGDVLDPKPGECYTTLKIVAYPLRGYQPVEQIPCSPPKAS